MKNKRLQAAGLLAAGALVCASQTAFAQTEITVADVNNPQMAPMRDLIGAFEKQHPDIKVHFVTLPENELRQKVLTDVATSAGQYDAVMISNYETPIWAKNGWLTPMTDLSSRYDVKDLIGVVRAGLSYHNVLYALPYNAESSMTYYRKDLFKQAGLTMPKRPTWSQIETFAKTLNDKSKPTYGICLRGLPGWGQNMALFSTMVNAYGGRWFNMSWQPELTSKAWHNAANAYVDLLQNYGPPGATSNGFTENETLFAKGQCAMWVDTTNAASYLSDANTSSVAGKTGYARAPYATTKRGSHWLYSWAWAVPKSAPNPDAAKTFVQWATSKQYIAKVGQKNGWLSVPPGTRHSTYDNSAYKKVAPFAGLIRQTMLTADPTKPSAKPVPYTGIQFVAIPQFQAIGTRIGQLMAGAVAGRSSVDQTLQQGQRFTERMMKQVSYDDQ